MPRRSTATMKDVAARAGVSLATVSRAMSSTTDVSDDLTRRIQNAAHELNYTVNFNARSLRSKSSGMIVVLIADISNSFFPVLLQGIEEQARAMGKAILIGDTAGDREMAATYARLIDGQRADGMILLNGNIPYGDIKSPRLTGRRYPIVAISERIAGADIPSVSINNVAACTDMVAYLAQIGHRRIAHLMGPQDNILSHERLEGYRKGVLMHACETWPGSVVPSGFSIRSGRLAMAQLLDNPVRPTAVFASNDESAIGAIIEAKSRGLKIPDDISIVGFDDIDFAQSYDPSLTTIYQPRRDMGRKAMQMLGKLLADPDRLQADAVLDYKLVVRASSAPPINR